MNVICAARLANASHIHVVNLNDYVNAFALASAVPAASLTRRAGCASGWSRGCCQPLSDRVDLAEFERAAKHWRATEFYCDYYFVAL